MKKTQVVILSVLVGLMVLSCLTGCGGSLASTTVNPWNRGQWLHQRNILSVVCSTSKENHQQLGETCQGKDKKGMESMLDLGKDISGGQRNKSDSITNNIMDGIRIQESAL